MKLTYHGLIANNLVEHTIKTVSNGEILTYYIDETVGWNYIDRYIELENKRIEYLDTLSTYNIGHKSNHIDFIRKTFNHTVIAAFSLSSRGHILNHFNYFLGPQSINQPRPQFNLESDLPH